MQYFYFKTKIDSGKVVLAENQFLFETHCIYRLKKPLTKSKGFF